MRISIETSRTFPEEVGKTRKEAKNTIDVEIRYEIVDSFRMLSMFSERLRKWRPYKIVGYVKKPEG